MQLSVILSHIDMGIFTLPQIQRGYVWNRTQVRNFMRSLYKGYPVGILLIWKTTASSRDIKGNLTPALGVHDLLLDGQQRITSLYGIIKGQAPPFFEGNSSSFLNLHFNVEEEEFEFYSPIMKNNSLWISVTDLMNAADEEYHFEAQLGEFLDKKSRYLKRLSTVCRIKSRDFQIETLTGEHITTDVVVDIFDRVNSGGTKLSKGDLALAKICADWPEAREEMKRRLQKWRSHGYRFRLDWLLRCINALLTGHGDFEELSRRKVTPSQVLDGLQRAETHIDTALNLLSAHLGVDDSSMLRSPNSIPALVSYLDSHGTPSQIQIWQLLYWYAHSALRGRYSSAVETRIRQDLVRIRESEDALAALIQGLRDDYGELRLWAGNFDASTARSRFFPTLYMLSRVYGARDLCSGIILDRAMVGKMGVLERHHLFPKRQLRKAGINKVSDINALANFTFLTQSCNLEISAKFPEDYFPYYEAKHPGVLASHWIPEDPHLWKIENYHEFLAERRELLSKAANSFLDQLYHGRLEPAETPTSSPDFDRKSRLRPISIATDEEEAALHEAMNWMEAKGLPSGELGYELPLADNGDAIVLDLAWPNGIQEGLSRKVALLIDETPETLATVNHADYEYFTNVDELKRHVQRDILGEPA